LAPQAPAKAEANATRLINLSFAAKKVELHMKAVPVLVLHNLCTAYRRRKTKRCFELRLELLFFNIWVLLLQQLGTSSSTSMPNSQGGLVALLYTVPTSILARSKFGGKTLLS